MSASVHAGIPPTRHTIPPGADTPPDQAANFPPDQTPWDQAHPAPSGADTLDQTPPRDQAPPRKQTPAYGQWAAGTHPTGMHSCYEEDYHKVTCCLRCDSNETGKIILCCPLITCFYMCLSFCPRVRGVCVWCHLLSGCLVPCSFSRNLCPVGSLSIGSLFRGLCQGGSLSKETPLPNQKSRRYASYWYAFLLIINSQHFKVFCQKLYRIIFFG